MKSVFFSSACACLLATVFLIGFSNAQNDDKSLRELVANLTESSEIVRKHIVDYLKLAEEAEKQRAEIDTHHIIWGYVVGNPKTVETKELLKLGREECKATFDEKLKFVIDSLENYSNSKVDEQIKLSKLHLETLDKEIESIHDALTKNLNYELNKCKKSGSPCKITGQYKTIVQDGGQFVKFIGLDLPTIPGKIPDRVGQHMAPKFIEEELVTPVTRCVKNYI